MSSRTTGTVTFLFTDIEGSTRLIQQLGDSYASVLAISRELICAAVLARGGRVDSEGDAIFATFPSARDALTASVTAQQRILRHPWPGSEAVRVRMGLHTGEVLITEAGYVGMDVHRAARICSAAHGGQILLSRSVRVIAESDLPPGVSLRDLGSYRLKDLEEPEHLFQVLHPDLPADFPPLKSAEVRPNNLPRQLTSFVGRERELDEIKRLLTTTCLVTLTGPGGAGKTRLAIQAAGSLLDQYADGVWLVELAALSDPALVPNAVASALGVPEQPRRPVSLTLLDYLKPRCALLVFDNCEHLLSACAQLASLLLRSCSHLRIIATSRERLGVPGEMAWPVPSMSVPDPESMPGLEQLARYEAVRLFVDRAMSTQQRFAVTPGNAASIAEVCARLDGMPLAIELAAARVKVLTPQQINARLDDRFRLLTASGVGVFPRHQTLQAAMDWSYDLLSGKERALLRRLAVFAGGWSLEAAEAVCRDHAIDPDEILDLLAQLVDKSIVVAEMEERSARYRLLETVREYGRNRLLEAGEDAAVRRRHRDWYLGLAEEAQLKLRGPDQATWVERLEVEHDNLRAALEWSKTEDSRGDTGLRLANALVWFWRLRCHFSEGHGWLSDMLSQSEGASKSARANALVGRALLAHRQGEYEGSIRLAAESLALFRELGESSGTGQALYLIGTGAQGQGDYGHAKTLLMESLILGREVGDKWQMATRLNALGEVARCQRDFAAALAFYEESLTLRREIGDTRGIAATLGNLGHVALYQRDCDQAGRLFRDSLGMAWQLADKALIAETLAGLGGVAAAAGQCAHAAGLLGAAENLLSILGFLLEPADHAAYQQSVAATRAGLSEAAFAEARAIGRAMTLDEAIRHALSEVN